MGWKAKKTEELPQVFKLGKNSSSVPLVKTAKNNFLFRVMSLDVRLAEVSGPAHLCVGDPLMDVPPANGCFEDPLLAPSKTSKKKLPLQGDVPGNDAAMDRPSRSLADRSLGKESLVAGACPTHDVPGIMLGRSLVTGSPGENNSLGANSEVNLGGRRCVNTLAGSVSVAGLQSNIVSNVCSESVRKNVMQNISGLNDTKRMMM